MMKCRYCGMESRTTQVCEWCKKTLASGPGNAQTSGGPHVAPLLGATPPTAPSLTDVTQQMPRPPAPNSDGVERFPTEITQQMPPPAAEPTRVMRTTLTGELIEVTQAMPPLQAPQYNAPPGATPPGGVPNYSPTHAVVSAAVTPGQLRDRYPARQERRDVSIGERFELFLAIALPVLLGSVYLVHAVPTMFLWVLIGDLFLLSFALGATGAVPGYDDAVADVILMLGIMFVVRILLFFPILGPYGQVFVSLFRPGVALLIYAVIGLVRQEWNTAIIGLFVLNIVIDGSLTYAMLTSPARDIGSLLMLGLVNWLKYFGTFLALLGWIISSLFRPMEAKD